MQEPLASVEAFVSGRRQQLQAFGVTHSAEPEGSASPFLPAGGGAVGVGTDVAGAAVLGKRACEPLQLQQQEQQQQQEGLGYERQQQHQQQHQQEASAGMPVSLVASQGIKRARLSDAPTSIPPSAPSVADVVSPSDRSAALATEAAVVAAPGAQAALDSRGSLGVAAATALGPEDAMARGQLTLSSPAARAVADAAAEAAAAGAAAGLGAAARAVARPHLQLAASPSGACQARSER